MDRSGKESYSHLFHCTDNGAKVAASILPWRTRDAIYRVVNKLEMVRLRKWKAQEYRILEQYYPVEGVVVAERLPGNTPHVVGSMVNQYGVLFLGNVAEPTADIVGGHYGDAETRKAVEEAAIKVVWKYLEDNGYTVKDRQSDNCGYDLYAQKGKNFILAEVKGTDSSQPRFLLSRNERAHSETDAGWRLFVVCKTRTSPKIRQYTADEMEAAFSFSPKSWECQPKIH